MANKLQINCVPENKITTEFLKREWNNIKNNREAIEALETELSQLEQNNPISIPVKNSNHPNYNQYITIIDLIEEFKTLIKLNHKWKRIYEAKLSNSTC